MSDFPHLFSPLTLNGCTIRNRIVSTGHDTAMSDDGLVNDRLIAYHEARARGGAGLIVVQVSGVHETARYTSHILMAVNDDAIPGYARLAERVHAHGAAIFGQLFHPGREIMETRDGTLPVAFAPSAVPNSRFSVMPVPLSEALIEDIIRGYGDGARRMEQAGFDGCEVVASHGYLPVQFLNPLTNRRTDQWGGSDDNRLRFLRRVVADIRAKTAPGFVLGLRLSGHDRDGGSMEVGQVTQYMRMLDGEDAFDYYSVVAGTSASLSGAIHIVPPMSYDPGYTAEYSTTLKQSVKRPVVVTGRINDPRIAEKLIAGGQADLCGMTRAMICDPDMPGKAMAGRAEDIRACIGCNQACIGHFHRGYPISCIQRPETGRERTYGALESAASPKRIIVAGGGVAGMKAAVTLARRGHQVTLHEASGRLGGQALLAQLLPGRAEFGGIVTNLQRELELAGVAVRRNAKVTRQVAEAEGAEVVIVATGATPYRPAVEIGDGSHVLNAWQVLEGTEKPGASVLVSEWRPDWIGIGLAEKLTREGCRVTLCSEAPMIGQNLPFYVRDSMRGTLYRLGVTCVTYARMFGMDGRTVYMEHAANGEAMVFEDVDTLVLSHGHRPADGLARELEGFSGAVHVIGDALAARTAEEAVFDGLRIGVEI